jgi:hypothetical protein
METAKMLKKIKNTKMIIAGYSPNRNWWNLIGTTSTSSGTRWAKKIGIGWTNFAAVAMETNKGGFQKIWDSFHQTSWNFVGISTVVCGSFWGGVEKIQNGGRCHGNQGAKNVKFTPNFTNFCSNVSCHIHI